MNRELQNNVALDTPFPTAPAQGATEMKMGYREPLRHLGRVMFGSELCGTLRREPGPALTSGPRLTSGTLIRGHNR